MSIWRRLPQVENRAAWIVLPILAFLAITPGAFLVFGSFRTDGPGAPFAQFTLDNWTYLFRPSVAQALLNSLLLGSGTAVIATAIGVPLAWFIVRTRLPARAALAALLMVPLLFSALLSALAWVGLLGPRAGLINELARNVFGIEGDLFSIYSVPGMLFVMSLHYAPYAYIAVRSALLNMDEDLESASRVLGASPLRTARRITLPILAPAILSALLLVMVLSGDELSVPMVLGLGIGFPVIPQLMYENMAEGGARPERAAALGLMLLVVMYGFLFLYRRALGARQRYVTVSGKGARATVKRTGRLTTVLGLMFIFLYLFVAVALPYAMLLLASFSSYFATTAFTLDILTLSNYTDILSNQSFLLAMRNTVILVFVGATAIALAAAITARLAAGGRRWWQGAIDYLALTPILASGLAIGIGILWAYVYLPLALYGTLGILLLAFLTKYLGHGHRILSAAVLQMSGELEEAALTLGSSRLRTFRTITLPLLRTPLASAWLLLAIFISLEVSTSVFLYTGGTITMAVFVWLRMVIGLPTTAFAGAAILATSTLVLIGLAQWRARALDRL